MLNNIPTVKIFLCHSRAILVANNTTDQWISEKMKICHFIKPGIILKTDRIKYHRSLYKKSMLIINNNFLCVKFLK